MRLKSFYAKTVTEAMHMIRDSLGEDAIIVATREEAGGKGVCVTAAMDSDNRRDDEFSNYSHTATMQSDDSAEDGWLQYDSEEEDGGVAEALTDVMLKHSVPEDIIDQVISCATVAGLEQPHIALVAALEHLFVFQPLSALGANKTFMLVGPPGAGKTLAAAKLAARGAMKGHRLNVVSTDTLRAGGVEQLAAFTRILDVPLHKARDDRELRRVLEQGQNSADFTIIDTGGFNPFRSDEMRDLARLMTAGNVTPVMVMPAGIDADECGEMARVYSTLGVRHMMSTRLDIGRRLGGLLSAAHQGGMIFADASDTPQVAEGLFALTPDRLANLLMPQNTGAASKISSTNSTSSKETTTQKRIVNAG